MLALYGAPPCPTPARRSSAILPHMLVSDRSFAGCAGHRSRGMTRNPCSGVAGNPSARCRAVQDLVQKNIFSNTNGGAAWKARGGQAHRWAGSSILKPSGVNFCHYCMIFMHRLASCLSVSYFLEGKPSACLHRSQGWKTHCSFSHSKFPVWAREFH